MIVGAGGLGVPAAIALARSRSVEIGLVDPDPVELSNLARQVIYRESDLGKPKVEAAAKHLRETFDGLTVETHRSELDSANAVSLISRYDFIIDATDNPTAKFLINDVCIKVGKPFVYGGVLGLTGQAMTVLPGETACIRCLFEEPPDPGEIASCREAGIVGPVAGAIGEIQAADAIAWAGGMEPKLCGRILTYEGAIGRIRVARVEPRRGCRCGAWHERTSPVPIP
jgi:molybdopterin/thiamine biosynthesis adenylyltransferase